jgi:hypothetical protein
VAVGRWRGRRVRHPISAPPRRGGAAPGGSRRGSGSVQGRPEPASS